MAPAIERVVFNLADNVTVKAKQGEMVELKEWVWHLVFKIKKQSAQSIARLKLFRPLSLLF